MGFRKEWLCAIPFPPLEIFFGFFFRKFIHRFLEGVKPLPYTGSVSYGMALCHSISSVGNFFGFFFRKFVHRIFGGVKPLPYTGSPRPKMLFVPIIEPCHGFDVSEYRRITDPFGTIRLL